MQPLEKCQPQLIPGFLHPFSYIHHKIHYNQIILQNKNMVFVKKKHNLTTTLRFPHEDTLNGRNAVE